MRYLSPIPPPSLNIPASRTGREFGQFLLAPFNQTLTTSRGVIISFSTRGSHPIPPLPQTFSFIAKGVEREF
jgi:hypothetical protein